MWSDWDGTKIKLNKINKQINKLKQFGRDSFRLLIPFLKNPAGEKMMSQLLKKCFHFLFLLFSLVTLQLHSIRLILTAAAAAVFIHCLSNTLLVNCSLEKERTKDSKDVLVKKKKKNKN